MRCFHFILISLLGSASTSSAEVTLSHADSLARIPQTGALNDAKILLEAARGEHESMQIILTGTPQEIEGIVWKADEFKGPGKATLPSPEILRGQYVKVKKSTPRAPLPPGDYLDPLVPQDFPWRTWPEKVSTVNQPWWIDAFVPYTSPAGIYTAQLQAIDAHGKALLKTEIQLKVHDFDLPVTPRLRSSFMTQWRRMAQVHGFDPQQDPPAPEAAAIMEAYQDFMAQHRLSFDQNRLTFPDPGTGKLDADKIERALRKQTLHRHVSTIGLPLWPTWPFNDPIGKDRDAAMLYCADWMKILHKIRQGGKGYFISGHLDEPNDEKAYEEVRRWGAFFNEASAKHNVHIPLLITEQPTPESDWWGSLDGFVDIWVPHFSSVYDDMDAPKGRHSIQRRLQQGDEVWCYAALVQMPQSWLDLHRNPATLTESNPPVWCLDYPAMNHRVLAWVLHRYGITGITYWDTLYAAEGVDIWEQADSFHSLTSDEVFNGDGSFIYPATKKRHGRHQPVASLRLKWLRDMCDDYDYLSMAHELQLGDEPLNRARTFARGIGDWDDDPSALFAARRAIAESLEKAFANQQGGKK